jgi:hypothetical protein
MGIAGGIVIVLLASLYYLFKYRKKFQDRLKKFAEDADAMKLQRVFFHFIVLTSSLTFDMYVFLQLKDEAEKTRLDKVSKFLALQNGTGVKGKKKKTPKKIPKIIKLKDQGKELFVSSKRKKPDVKTYDGFSKNVNRIFASDDLGPDIEDFEANFELRFFTSKNLSTDFSRH